MRAAIGIGVVALVLLGILFSGGFFMSDGAKALQEMSANPHLAEDVFDPLADQDAPRVYREIVAQVLSGGVPHVERLSGLGSGLERSYGIRPQPANGGFQYQRRINILEHALRAGNLEAVRAVLEAGHDPNLAGFEFARAAAANPTGPPDWSTSPPFLEAYLEYGGNPDYATQTDSYPLIKVAGVSGNFDGVKVLLAGGADPWIEVRGLGWPENPSPPEHRDHAVPSVIRGAEDQIEFFIWLHENGYVDTAPVEMQALLYDHRLDMVQWYTEPENHRDDSYTALLRDAFAASLDRDIAYRRDDRETFVAALTDYLDARAQRP